MARIKLYKKKHLSWGYLDFSSIVNGGDDISQPYIIFQSKYFPLGAYLIFVTGTMADACVKIFHQV